MKKVTVFHLWIVMIILAIGSKTANTCSPMACLSGFTIPSYFSEIDHIPQVPTNIGGILWSPNRHFESRENAVEHVWLYKVGKEEIKIPVSISKWSGSGEVYVIAPTEELEPAEHYELRTSDLCDYHRNPKAPLQITKFITSQNFKLPALLGDIKDFPTVVVHDRSVRTSSGSCHTGALAAEKFFEIDISPEFVPWIEAAEISTIVDDGASNKDVKITFDSTTPKISTSLFHTCQSEDSSAEKGIDEGTHKIRFQAKLPNTDVILETSDLEFELRCPSVDHEAGKPDDIVKGSVSLIEPSEPVVAPKNEVAKPGASIGASPEPIVASKTSEQSGVGCQSTGAAPTVFLFLARFLRRPPRKRKKLYAKV